MKRYWLETYGCQMNKAESGSLELELQARGWQPAQGIAEADLVVLNTCSVRKTAEDRIWGRLGFFKAEKRRTSRRGRSLRLVLMGCMAERLKEEILNQAPHVDVLIGTFQKHRLPELLEEEMGTSSFTGLETYRFAGGHTPGGFRALVPIMHGCDNFCTYCIVPLVRGRELSRSPQSILEEIAGLESSGQGVREITLLGQNVNSYRYNDLDFPGLLRSIIASLSGKTWLRFLTSHPKDVSAELIRLLAQRSALCRHLHLPVQHGSDRILQAMGRGYSRSRFLALIESIRKNVPEISLTTDILIGFPGETEEDYRLTLELMNEIQFDDAFTYRYNPREGTPAYALGDGVPDAVKQERLAEVIRLQRLISRRRKQGRIGSVVEVLVEGVSKKNPRELLARTESDEMVVFPGSPERIGGFARVRLETLEGNTFLAGEASG